MSKNIKTSSLNSSIILLFLLLIFGCSEKNNSSRDQINYSEQVAYDFSKDADIQRTNLEIRKNQTKERFPCDTISVIEHILDTYPPGTYLLDFDRTTTYNIPKEAIIYHSGTDGAKYIFTLIATSRPGERLIEPTNIIGYDQSFIDLDSTKLGTPFLYLVLFRCEGATLIKQWEAPVPSHGGFNSINLKRWDAKNVFYIESNFHYAQGIGHINYNYFLIDGYRILPHLLMTYSGTSFKRTLANINNDKYPDYYEHLFYNFNDKVYSKDSIAFLWSLKDTLYINTRNQKQTRPY